MSNTFSSDILWKLGASALMTLREEPLLAAGAQKDFKSSSQIGQTAYFTKPYALDAGAISPAMYPPTPDGMANAVVTQTIDQHYGAKFGLTETDIQRYMLNGVVPQQLLQAVRTLANQINTATWATYTQVYGLAGAAGTGAFASAATTYLGVLYRTLSQQLCPKEGRQLVISLKDAAAIRITDNLAKYINVGDKTTIREGTIGNVMGFLVREDHHVPVHTTGTISGITLNGNHAKGASTISVTGTCALKEGDLITVGTDTTKTYSVQADATITATTGDVVLDRGLEAAVATGATVAIASGHGTGVINIAGDLSGFGIGLRPGAVDQIAGGWTLGDHVTIVDDLTGIPMSFSRYAGYHMGMFEVSVQYGVCVVDARLLARLYSYTTLI